MKTLETDQPLAQSQIWQIVCNYYLNRGTRSWTEEEIPSFVTSSCYIANYYAQTIIHAMQDWASSEANSETSQANANNIFYIVELGAGLGEFAFHCVKQLCELQKQYGLTQLKFCYILADVVPDNLNSWQNSQAFDDYIQQGQVDFALYNMATPEILELTESKIKLDKTQLSYPLTVIGNYIFDSVPTDVFYVASEQVSQGHMTLTAPEDFNVASPEDLTGLHTTIRYKRVPDSAIYPEPIYNEIIEDYRRTIGEAIINFPIAALRYLQFLMDLSQGRMLLLLADKGYSTKSLMAQIDQLDFEYHYAISILVNFHAVEQFFKHYHGDSVYQDRFTQLTTAVYTAGMCFDDMPATKRFLQVYRQEMSPQQYCRMLYQLSHFSELDALSMLAIFRMSKHDPLLLRLFHRHLMRLTNPRRVHFNGQLREIIAAIRDNIYPLRYTDQIKYFLGCVYHVMGDYQQALALLAQYQPSQQHEYEYYQRLIDCYQQLGDVVQAQALLPQLRQAKWRFKRGWYYLKFKRLIRMDG